MSFIKFKKISSLSMLSAVLFIMIGLSVSGSFNVQAQKLSIAARSAAMPPNEAANLDQCRNGGVGETPQPCTGSGGGNAGYVNGNAGGENAHYTEGDSIPYRVRFTGLTVGSTNTIVIEYDTTQQGKNAIDYLTSYDRTETAAKGNDPCSDVLSQTICSSPQQFAIPETDERVLAGRDGILNTADDINPIDGFFTCFGCTVTAVSDYSYTGDFTGNSTASLTITFTANVENPIIAFGGHIATRNNWGANSSASTIPGSPYHTRLLSLNGASVGQQDRSLNSNAVNLVQIPTAASVSITGRVITQSGRGIRNVLIRLTDESGQTKTVVSSSFGYYRFADVAAGQTYTISAVSKKFTFEQPSRALSLVGDTDGVNFVAQD